MEVLKELSTVEVRKMLEASAWRKVREEWDQEMETKPKLEILKRIVKLGEWSDCARVVRRADRRMMIKLRGGTAGCACNCQNYNGFCNGLLDTATINCITPIDGLLVIQV